MFGSDMFWSLNFSVLLPPFQNKYIKFELNPQHLFWNGGSTYVVIWSININNGTISHFQKCIDLLNLRVIDK